MSSSIGIFYLYNNWRSGFNGANDHEADWEMVCIYLAHGAGGNLQPEWVAFASHDYAGDDLRRRWDDPEIQKVGNHPVIFSGAGSHSSYFSAGEYLTELELKFLSPVSRLVDFVVGRWRAIQGPGDPDELPRPNDQYAAPYASHQGGSPTAAGGTASQASESQRRQRPWPWLRSIERPRHSLCRLRPRRRVRPRDLARRRRGAPPA